MDHPTIFKKTDKKIQIIVKYPIPTIFDSLDNSKKWLGWDKSPTALVGYVKFCGGPPINLHVDVDKKIKRLNLAGKHL